jgi:excisionase family DNA binding protein
VASEGNNYYSATEAAQILRQSPQHIRALVSEGKLPGERQGEEWRIPAWAVHERLERTRFVPGRDEAPLESSEAVWELQLYGKLPRDRQEKHFYPQEAVKRPETTRALVQQGGMPKTEAALRRFSGSGGEDSSDESPARRVDEPFALAFEELRRLQELAEEQKRRIASMESKLEAQPPSEATEAPVSGDRRPDKVAGTPQEIEDIQKKKNARLRAQLEAKRSKGFY